MLEDSRLRYRSDYGVYLVRYLPYTQKPARAAPHRIWIPSATAIVAFLCYTLIQGQKLTVSKAFTALALFSYLQGPMATLPGQIQALLTGIELVVLPQILFMQFYSPRIYEAN